jgi:hypothetical protein
MEDACECGESEPTPEEWSWQWYAGNGKWAKGVVVSVWGIRWVTG